MLISHAQNFEDVILWRALKHVTNGRYLDIGAHDPVVDSVSLLFYERGWRGVHVEPVAEYAEKIRAAREGDTVVAAAVSDTPGAIDILEIPGSGLTTAVAEIARQHIASGLPGKTVQTPTISLEAVLALCAQGPVHWMKIDVEGMEKSVLESWGDSPVRPWVAVVESTMPLSQTPSHEEWEALLLERDYRFVHFDGLNRFYLHKDHLDLEAAFEAGPNLWDRFALSDTATSAPVFGAVFLGKLAAIRAEAEALRARLETQSGDARAAHEGLGAAAARAEGLAAALAIRDAELAEAVKREIIQHDARVAIEAQRDEIAALLAQTREQAEQRAADLARVRAEAERMAADLARARALADERAAELSRERARADAAGETLDQIYASRGWRLLAKARRARQWLGAQLKHGLAPRAPDQAFHTGPLLVNSPPEPAAKKELEMPNLHDVLFPRVVLDNWQMMPWEQIALTGVLARLKPKVTLEVGVYYGGSLSLTSQFAEKIYAIDIDPEVPARFAKPANVDLIIGDSTVEVPNVLRRIEAAGEDLEFVLIDADHSSAGVKRDIELILQYRPRKTMIILMHDSGNPGCRAGIKAANWARNEYVHAVELDFVPGQIIEHTVPTGRPEVWGGFAIALLGPTPRTHPLILNEAARTSIDAIHRFIDRHAHA